MSVGSTVATGEIGQSHYAAPFAVENLREHGALSYAAATKVTRCGQLTPSADFVDCVVDAVGAEALAG